MCSHQEAIPLLPVVPCAPIPCCVQALPNPLLGSTRSCSMKGGGGNAKVHSMNGDLLIVLWIQSNVHMLCWILAGYLLDLAPVPLLAQAS